MPQHGAINPNDPNFYWDANYGKWIRKMGAPTGRANFSLAQALAGIAQLQKRQNLTSGSALLQSLIPGGNMNLALVQALSGQGGGSLLQQALVPGRRGNPSITDSPYGPPILNQSGDVPPISSAIPGGQVYPNSLSAQQAPVPGRLPRDISPTSDSPYGPPILNQSGDVPPVTAALVPGRRYI